MRSISPASVRDDNRLGWIGQMADGEAAFTLGGAAYDGAGEAGRSDRIAGVGHIAMSDPPDRHSGIEEFGGIASGAASLSGAAARSERPEAMLARGSRVTGSGGAAWATSPTAEPARSVAAGVQAIFLPHGGSVSFAVLADFRPEIFL